MISLREVVECGNVKVLPMPCCQLNSCIVYHIFYRLVPNFPPSFIFHLSFLNVCLKLLGQRGLYHRPQVVYLSDPGRYTSLSFLVKDSCGGRSMP